MEILCFNRIDSFMKLFQKHFLSRVMYNYNFILSYKRYFYCYENTFGKQMSLVVKAKREIKRFTKLKILKLLCNWKPLTVQFTTLG